MDLAVFFGMAVSFAMISIALLFGGEALAFLNLPSFFIVVGGTLGATLTQYPASLIFSVLKKSLARQKSDFTPTTLMEECVNLAYFARREGILALEARTEKMEDYYLRKGFQLAIDGLDLDTIRSIMESEMGNASYRHERGAQVLDAMASYAPALGLMGTVIGLVQMLNTMDDPSSIGPAMAVALITTFYGIVLANLVFSPLSGKLRLKSQEELLVMEMGMQGILGIAQGEHPRILREKLTPYLESRDETRGGVMWREIP